MAHGRRRLVRPPGGLLDPQRRAAWACSGSPPRSFTNYSLKLDWKLVKDDNGGVFVGFPNPGNDPNVAINQGYEIQIDAVRRARPHDRLDLHVPGRGPRAVARGAQAARASGTRTRSRSRARTSRCSSTACWSTTSPAPTRAGHLAGLHRRPEPRRRRDHLVPQHPHQGWRDPAARRPARVPARLVQQAAGLHGRLAAGVRRGRHEGPGRRRRLRVLDGQAPGGQLRVQGRPQPQLGRELRR